MIGRGNSRVSADLGDRALLCTRQREQQAGEETVGEVTGDRVRDPRCFSFDPPLPPHQFELHPNSSSNTSRRRASLTSVIDSG